ncbi:MAG: cupredoxin domain-containing protein [Nitrospirae bacterium]|nr:cupredoxin domain-containing protein [Nitrospirota bacterium]
MNRFRWIFIAGLLTAASGQALADERPPSDELRRITVRLQEYRFQPAEIALRTGQEVELTLINDGTVMHEFITEALQTLTVDVEINGIITGTLGVTEIEIPPKSSVLLRFILEKAGEYLIACRAKAPKDHYQEGMKGHLLIR